MKTIETDVHISEDKIIHLTLPEVSELQPGIYHVVVVIDDEPMQPVAETKKKPLKLHEFELKGWPADCTFRRKDIYNDDGR